MNLTNYHIVPGDQFFIIGQSYSTIYQVLKIEDVLIKSDPRCKIVRLVHYVDSLGLEGWTYIEKVCKVYW